MSRQTSRILAVLIMVLGLVLLVADLASLFYILPYAGYYALIAGVLVYFFGGNKLR